MKTTEDKEFLNLCRHNSIQSIKGEWQTSDMYWQDGYVYILCGYCDTDREGNFLTFDNSIWIPPVFNLINPIRSLWGKMNWERYAILDRKNGAIAIVWRQDPTPPNFQIIGGSLPLALIRTIVWDCENIGNN